jgi:HAD superfamily hydrolase (TIGR01509 family)
MRRKHLKAIIFDMDGVLVDTEPHHTIIEKRLFARLNLNIGEEEHKRYLGMSPVQMWKEIIRNYNLSYTPDNLAQKSSEEILSYFSGPEEIRLMSGIRKLLEELYVKGIPIALASSSDIKTIDILLSRTGLRGYFQHKVSSEMVGRSKPEPDIYLYTAGLLSVRPEECLVIEDSLNGISAAKKAGMYCVAYKGITSEPPDKSLADTTITNFSDLPEILHKFKML